MFPLYPTLDECREVTQNCKPFKENNQEEYITFNYAWVSWNMFDIDELENKPRLTNKKRYIQIKKEMRGIIFSHDGTILARRFHKFFNTIEKNPILDMSQPHTIMNKLDGILVSPFKLGNKIRFGTKAGITDISEYLENTLITENPSYFNFANYVLEQGKTPLFEYCTSYNPIVINYSHDHLTLLAIRDITTGEYMKYQYIKELGNKYNIPVVSERSIKIENVSKLGINSEGVVIMFENGEFWKIKTEWYLRQNNINRQDPPSHIWKSAFNDILDDSNDLLLRKFDEEFKRMINSMIQELETMKKYHHLTRKDFYKISQNKFLVKLHMLVYNGKEPYETIRNFIESSIKNQKTRKRLCERYNLTNFDSN